MCEAVDLEAGGAPPRPDQSNEASGPETPGIDMADDFENLDEAEGNAPGRLVIVASKPRPASDGQFEKVENGETVPAFGENFPARTEYLDSITNATPVYPWVRCSRCNETLVWRRGRNGPFAACKGCRYGNKGAPTGGCRYTYGPGKIYGALVKWHLQGPGLIEEGTTFVTPGEPDNEKETTKRMVEDRRKDQERAATQAAILASSTTVADGTSTESRLSGQQLLRSAQAGDGEIKLGFGPAPKSGQATRGFQPQRCGCR